MIRRWIWSKLFSGFFERKKSDDLRITNQQQYIKDMLKYKTNERD